MEQQSLKQQRAYESKERRKKRGKIWRQLRTDKRLSVSQAASLAGLSEGTIKNIEKGESDPSFHALSSLLQCYEVSNDIMKELLDFDPKSKSVTGGNDADSHWKLLERFRNKAYRCLYIRDDINKLRSLNVDCLARNEQGGFLEAHAEESGRKYECKVTCTMSARFVHFQLASGLTGACDRVSILVPYPQNMAERDKFRVGVGAILSLSSLGSGDDAQWPCFQLAAIIERELAESLEDTAAAEICKKHLVLPADDTELPGFGYRIGVRDIQMRSHDLFRELVPKEESNTEG